eukprot:scpid108841/ scgid22587/ 
MENSLVPGDATQLSQVSANYLSVPCQVPTSQLRRHVLVCSRNSFSINRTAKCHRHRPMIIILLLCPQGLQSRACTCLLANTSSIVADVFIPHDIVTYMHLLRLDGGARQ